MEVPVVQICVFVLLDPVGQTANFPPPPPLLVVSTKCVCSVRACRYVYACVRVCVQLVWYIHSVSGQVSVSWVVTFVTCAVHHCLIHACSLVLASISCIHSLPVLNMLWKSSSHMEVPRYFAQERVVSTYGLGVFSVCAACADGSNSYTDFMCLYLMIHCDPFSNFAGEGVVIVVSVTIWSIVLLICSGCIITWSVCQRRSAREKRSPNVETAQVSLTSAGINREATVVQILHVPPINPDPPPPHVLIAIMQSSDPPPYAGNPTYHHPPIYVEGTNKDVTLEYLPHPESSD